MQTKEIIIDGVDVSGCSYYNPLGNYNCGGTKKCSQWSNCYFKQLVRKTQLSIEQSKELIRLRKELQESTIKNRNLKQECEELKNLIFNWEQINKVQEVDIDRYRKALEEIEEEITALHYITIPFHRGITHELADIVQEYKNKILDIINKTKGEEDE